MSQRLELAATEPELLAALVGSVELSINYPEGVPYRRTAGALQPLEVYARYVDTQAPVYGAVVALVDASGAPLVEPVSTNDQGFVTMTLPVGMEPASGVRVVLQVPAAAHGAPLVPVTLREITLANARVAVKLDVVMGEASVADTDAIATFAASWKQRGGAEPEALAPELAGLLASPKETELVVRDIGTQDQGKLDILVLGSVHTAFANRMGARSVWHQATGVVQVYDMWTGQRIAEHTRDVQAVGLGDAAAATKAVGELMRLVAADVVADVSALTGGDVARAAFNAPTSSWSR